MNQVIGKDKLSEYTANIAFAGFTAPKVSLDEGIRNRKIIKNIAKIMLPKDYLAYRLIRYASVQICQMHPGMLLV